jgi:hypothetical protein
MQIRLRQVALVAADLSSVEADIGERLGLRPCYRDPGVARFGLHNVLFPVGEQLLEVVSPTEPDTTAGRLLDKRGGDGGYMVILQVDDLGPHRRRFDRIGARVVFEGAVEGITGLHLHPRDVGGAILSVDRADDWDSWPWAGADWRRHVCTDVVQGIRAVEVQAADPAAMAGRWSEVLGIPSQGTKLPLDEGEVRFVEALDGRGEGVSGLELAASRNARFELGGVRVSLVP